MCWLGLWSTYTGPVLFVFIAMSVGCYSVLPGRFVLSAELF